MKNKLFEKKLKSLSSKDFKNITVKDEDWKYLGKKIFELNDIEIGFIMRGEIIWQKSKGANANFAWGSWLSASNPVIRDIHEYCLVFSKDSMKNSSRGISTIEKDEFMESTLSIWNINPEKAKKIGHPAPFPVELPKRFINLYSFKKDLVLDPFIGSGTTAIASKQLQRNYVGYEINKDYIEIADKRLRAETS